MGLNSNQPYNKDNVTANVRTARGVSVDGKSGSNSLRNFFLDIQDSINSRRERRQFINELNNKSSNNYSQTPINNSTTTYTKTPVNANDLVGGISSVIGSIGSIWTSVNDAKAAQSNVKVLQSDLEILKATNNQKAIEQKTEALALEEEKLKSANKSKVIATVLKIVTVISVAGIVIVLIPKKKKNKKVALIS